MALPEFRNEQEFRDNWIAPFLAKLGFMLVKNTHGTGEQGKDFFFAEYDRFGHTRVFAAQVKLGNIGSGSAEISDLLDQVKRCFGVRLRFHKSAHERRIASVYVMTNGKISEQARERIHDWCDQERFGENVFFLDGEQLENKDRFATYESDQEKRQLLEALQNELFQNIGQLQVQNQQSSQGVVFFPTYRLSSLDAALQRLPWNADANLTQTMEELWRCLTTFNAYKSPMNINWDDISKRTFCKMADTAQNHLVFLVDHCAKQRRILNERYSLEATCIVDE